MSFVRSKDADGNLNVFMSGKVTREPRLLEAARGDHIKFSVSYAKKKYMDCDVWADSPAGEVAACLEVGDYILITGTHRSWEYNDKTYQSITVDGIFLQTTPLAPSVPDAPSPAAKEAVQAGKFVEVDDDWDRDESLPF